MIIETILSLQLIHNSPKIVTLMPNVATVPSYIFGAYSSRSSFSRSSGSSYSRSYSSGSSSYSRPSSFSSSRSYSSPSFSNSYSRSSTPSSTVRVTKQTSTPTSTVYKAPSLPSTSSTPTSTVYKSPSVPQTTRVVTREHYINHYNNSGPLNNPFFWLYMMDNKPQQREIVVNNTSGDPVKIPENQMIVKKYSYSPVREFFVFLLGSGVGVAVGRKFTL